MIKKYLINFSWSLGIMLIGTVLLTIINYFNLLAGKTLEIIEALMPLVAIFIGSYKIGKDSVQRGWLEGLKYAGIWLIIFLIASVIIKSLRASSVIYFLAIILTSTLSAMVGINRRPHSK